MSSRAAPLVPVVLVTPLIVLMKGPDVDTPDQRVALNLPVLANYSNSPGSVRRLCRCLRSDLEA